MNDPHGTLAVVFSMIPLTSPIVMLMRIPFGVPLWQIAISVSLRDLLSVVWFAAKIYRGNFNVWKETYMERIIQMA
jgi:ABC-2 type transport system permease protein